MQTTIEYDKPEKKRFIVQFPDNESYIAAQAIEMPGGKQKILDSSERNFFTLELNTTEVTLNETFESNQPSEQATVENVLVAGDGQITDDPFAIFRTLYNAEVVEDFQYDIEDSELFNEELFVSEADMAGSMDDVLGLVYAGQAWEAGYRGDNVDIAIVDTGISGSRPEFPVSKRRGGWAPPGGNAWTDQRGHGSMCAAIAAGTKASGGLVDGIAPNAGLIACKTAFYTSELISIYQYLINFISTSERRLVASNSYGIRSGSAPSSAPNKALMRVLSDAVNAGITLVYSAGNNHELTGGSPTSCSPTSIWSHKGRKDLLAVATCDLDLNMWYYSSRGPGQYYAQPDTEQKPDVTAPTPRNGLIVYGDSMRVLPNGWGTSGACPQISGLAALMLSKDPTLNYTEVFEKIRNNATGLGLNYNCQGAGLINVASTVNAV